MSNDLDTEIEELGKDVPTASQCSKTEATNLFFISYLHSLGNLTGFSQVIDKQTEKKDHYKALERTKDSFSVALDSTRWTVTEKLMQDNAQLSQDSVNTLMDLVQLIDTQTELNKKQVQDKLDIYNYMAITSTIFLYIISFVLIVFVKWK